MIRILLLSGTAALEEDAQILRVIEAYCTGASLHQTTTGVCVCVCVFLDSTSIATNIAVYQRFLLICLCVAAVRKECIPQVLLPEEEKIIVEEMKSNGQTVIEEK